MQVNKVEKLDGSAPMRAGTIPKGGNQGFEAVRRQGKFIKREQGIDEDDAPCCHLEGGLPWFANIY
jgi:hypothetical protein